MSKRRGVPKRAGWKANDRNAHLVAASLFSREQIHLSHSTEPLTSGEPLTIHMLRKRCTHFCLDFSQKPRPLLTNLSSCKQLLSSDTALLGGPGRKSDLCEKLIVFSTLTETENADQLID
jgi:hypothetical protein